MANLKELENTMPVAPLKIIPLSSMAEMGKRINDYMVVYRDYINNETVKNDPAFHGYLEDSYLVDVDCPRFGTGEGKAIFHESIRERIYSSLWMSQIIVLLIEQMVISTTCHRTTTIRT